MAHKKTTGKKAASNVGRVLSSPKSTKAEKSAAASALSQTKSKKRGSTCVYASARSTSSDPNIKTARHHMRGLFPMRRTT